MPKRVKSIFFSKFSTNISLNKIAENLHTYPYNEEKSFGYNNIQLIDDHLNATLVKKSSTFIQDYDEEIFQIVKKQIFLFNSIDFSLDLKRNLLSVYGSASQMNLLKSSFRNSLKYDYILDTINIDTETFLETALNKNIKTEIQQITIKNFNYSNSIVGRFSGEVLKQSTAYDIINKYKRDLAKVTLKVYLHEEDYIIIQLLSNGNLKFLSEENEVEFYLNHLKEIIFF